MGSGWTKGIVLLNLWSRGCCELSYVSQLDSKGWSVEDLDSFGQGAIGRVSFRGPIDPVHLFRCAWDKARIAQSQQKSIVDIFRYQGTD